MKKKDIGKTVVSMLLICAVLLGAYTILHSREGKRGNDSTKTSTEAQLLLQKDFLMRMIHLMFRVILVWNMSEEMERFLLQKVMILQPKKQSMLFLIYGKMQQLL